jgi:hypothetical protein
MADSKRKRLLRRSGVALLALMAVLLVANWAVGRHFPVRSFIYRLDEEILHELIPGTRRVLIMDERVGGERISIRVNSDGFRGPELGASGERARIAVYGDSLVMASNVEYPDTFVRRLAVQLEAAAGGSYETVNAGITGYGPDQTCLKLERELDELAPGLVVLVLCAHNDFGDLIRNKLFRVNAEGALERLRPTLGKLVRDDFEQKRVAGEKPALWRLYEQVRETREQAQMRQREADFMRSRGMQRRPWVKEFLLGAKYEFQDYVSGGPEVKVIWQDYYDADIAIVTDSPMIRYKRRLMSGVLERLRDHCRARDIPLVALVVPSAVDLCEDFEIRVSPSVWEGYEPSRQTGSLMTILTELEVPALDLYGPFRDADPDALFVGIDDFHWNAAGQDLAARLLARFLIEHGRLLPR